jgi:hypothetical protein
MKRLKLTPGAIYEMVWIGPEYQWLGENKWTQYLLIILTRYIPRA